ncbi:hypothetical protein BKA70DRAFT_1319904 [Coprinopsis sp. MPI-PUGE-AT-0042]|nr:hypothetical protein BKA70DRAFT_1319904 [Coprinopsis sp. MPI-PUGE-AT-0042]
MPARFPWVASSGVFPGIAILWATRIPTLQYMDVRRNPDHSYKDPSDWLMIERENKGMSIRRLGVQHGHKIRQSWDEQRPLSRTQH